MKEQEHETIYKTFIEHLENGDPFSFARYGDGEWNAIFQVAGANCDGHEYFPDMGERLARIVRSEPPYFMGMAAIARRVWGERIEAFLSGSKLRWVNADLLHIASIEDRIWPFFDALSKRDVILVAPAHVQEQKLFKVRRKITIPEKNCWLASEDVNAKISVKADRETVICYCASMAANVWIDEWAPYATNIDLGSLIDPYVGRITRSHHKKVKV